MKDSKAVVIKNVKKKVVAGGHGGSWKVAYADFVTAMMAFFLLLWLITMVSPEKRARVAAYFRHFSIYDKGGISFLEKNSAILNETGGEFNIPREYGRGTAGAPTSPAELAAHLKKEVAAKLGDARDQVLVEVTAEGVRIQLVDKAGNPIFPLGGAEPSETAREMLRVIAENIRGLGNRIVIDGHTDALSYSSNRYTNWELSTERAAAARKELEKNGLNPDRLARVAGFAATEPLIRDNPNDPRNRRISITLLYPRPEEEKPPRRP